MHKYFIETRNQFRNRQGTNRLAAMPVRRTAWANESVTWPTYMYFSIAVVSLAFNTGIMFALSAPGMEMANNLPLLEPFFHRRRADIEDL